MSQNLCSPLPEKTYKKYFVDASVRMKSYGIPAISLKFIIDAFNNSFGYTTSTTTVFFQNTVSDSHFSLSAFTNFWTNTNNTNTAGEIDIIYRFILDEASRNRNGIERFITLFVNPYLNFIIDLLFCNLNKPITFSQSDNTIVSSNLYRLLRGGGTGEDGGTRGGGTLKLCDYCTIYFSKQTDPYNNLTQNSYAQSFCGCCSQLIKHQPVSFSQKGETLPLICQPICNKNEVIKAYNGPNTLVNNGLNNTNPSEDNYSRNTCTNQTICVINNVNISILGGDNKVVFNQVCPGCVEGSCVCYIDFSEGGALDTVTDGVEGLQNNVTFKQNCPHSFCMVDDKFVPCNPFNKADTGKNPNINYNGDGNITHNNSNKTKDAYIFGLQNWLVPIYFLVILIIVTISILSVNIKNISREIYIIKHG